MTRHVLSAHVKEDDIEQRHENIFHTRCHVDVDHFMYIDQIFATLTKGLIT